MKKPLKTQLEQQLSDKDTIAIAQSIFGTADIPTLHDRLNHYCQQQFGRAIAHCNFAYFSVGATFIVHLEDRPKEETQTTGNQAVVIKAYSANQSLSQLIACCRVQQALAQAGFPCPRILSHPQRVASTLLTAQSVGRSVGNTAHEEYLLHSVPNQNVPNQSALEELRHIRHTHIRHTHIRHNMARHLAHLIQRAKVYPQQDISTIFELKNASLWHSPHSVLFNFEKTAAGAEWIDAIAQPAKEILRSATGPLVIGHSDWSLQNMKFSGPQLTCVYDWDSLRIGPEACFVGHAARCYRHDWRDGPPEPAISVEEAQDFIQTYEQARGTSFTQAEYRVAGAAVVYAAAYGVRCVHALHTTLQQSTHQNIQQATQNSHLQNSHPKNNHYESAKNQLRAFQQHFMAL